MPAKVPLEAKRDKREWVRSLRPAEVRPSIVKRLAGESLPARTQAIQERFHQGTFGISARLAPLRKTTTRSKWHGAPLNHNYFTAMSFENPHPVISFGVAYVALWQPQNANSGGFQPRHVHYLAVVQIVDLAIRNEIEVRAANRASRWKDTKA